MDYIVAHFCCDRRLTGNKRSDVITSAGVKKWNKTEKVPVGDWDAVLKETYAFQDYKSGCWITFTAAYISGSKAACVTWMENNRNRSSKRPPDASPGNYPVHEVQKRLELMNAKKKKTKAEVLQESNRAVLQFSRSQQKRKHHARSSGGSPNSDQSSDSDEDSVTSSEDHNEQGLLHLASQLSGTSTMRRKRRKHTTNKENSQQQPSVQTSLLEVRQRSARPRVNENEAISSPSYAQNQLRAITQPVREVMEYGLSASEVMLNSNTSTSFSSENLHRLSAQSTGEYAHLSHMVCYGGENGNSRGAFVPVESTASVLNPPCSVSQQSCVSDPNIQGSAVQTATHQSSNGQRMMSPNTQHILFPSADKQQRPTAIDSMQSWNRTSSFIPERSHRPQSRLSCASDANIRTHVGQVPTPQPDSMQLRPTAIGSMQSWNSPGSFIPERSHRPQSRLSCASDAYTRARVAEVPTPQPDSMQLRPIATDSVQSWNSTSVLNPERSHRPQSRLSCVSDANIMTHDGQVPTPQPDRMQHRQTAIDNMQSWNSTGAFNPERSRPQSQLSDANIRSRVGQVATPQPDSGQMIISTTAQDQSRSNQQTRRVHMNYEPSAFDGMLRGNIVNSTFGIGETSHHPASGIRYSSPQNLTRPTSELMYTSNTNGQPGQLATPIRNVMTSPNGQNLLDSNTQSVGEDVQHGLRISDRIQSDNSSSNSFLEVLPPVLMGTLAPSVENEHAGGGAAGRGNSSVSVMPELSGPGLSSASDDQLTTTVNSQSNTNHAVRTGDVGNLVQSIARALADWLPNNGFSNPQRTAGSSSVPSISVTQRLPQSSLEVPGEVQIGSEDLLEASAASSHGARLKTILTSLFGENMKRMCVRSGPGLTKIDESVLKGIFTLNNRLAVEYVNEMQEQNRRLGLSTALSTEEQVLTRKQFRRKVTHVLSSSRSTRRRRPRTTHPPVEEQMQGAADDVDPQPPQENEDEVDDPQEVSDEDEENLQPDGDLHDPPDHLVDCTVCYAAENNRAQFNCRYKHRVCWDCGERLIRGNEDARKCPLCRQPVTDVTEVVALRRHQANDHPPQ